MSERLIKWAGISAVAGGLWAVILTPLISAGYYRAYAVSGETAPFWFSAAQPLMNFLFGFADVKVVYATFGKLFAAVYPLLAPGVWALHKRQGRAGGGGGSKLERFGFVFLLAALAVSFAGVCLDYWEIRPGWTVELAGMLLLQFAATVYGAASLRLKIIPRSIALLMAASVPLCVIAFLLVKQIPSAPTLPFALASLAAGAFLLRRQSETF